MHLNYFLRLLLLSILVYAGVVVDMDISSPQPQVDVNGEFTHLVTELERKAFGIEDEQLKKAVAAYTNDIEPYHVSVNNYRTRHMCVNVRSKLTTTVKPRLVNITNKCVPSGSWEYIQNNMTINNKWEIIAPISVNENINYKIRATKDLLFKSAWKTNFIRSDYLGKLVPTKNEEAGGDIPFVGAIKCTAIVELEYVATISGYIVADYSSIEKMKYHKQAYNVSELQDVVRLPNGVINKEVIFITYYYKHMDNDGNDNFRYENYNEDDYKYNVYDDIV